MNEKSGYSFQLCFQVLLLLASFLTVIYSQPNKDTDNRPCQVTSSTEEGTTTGLYRRLFLLTIGMSPHRWLLHRALLCRRLRRGGCRHRRPLLCRLLRPKQ